MLTIHHPSERLNELGRLWMPRPRRQSFMTPTMGEGDNVEKCSKVSRLLFLVKLTCTLRSGYPIYFSVTQNKLTTR